MTSLHLCITFMHLADAFYPKRLTVHSGYTFFFWSVCVFPGTSGDGLFMALLWIIDS